MTLALNVATLTSVLSKGNENLIDIFLDKYNSKRLKANEVNDLISLVSYINNQSLFEGFHIGYEINQIGKEFDLLKVTDHKVLNLEIKSEKDLLKINEQQLKNLYYLETLDREVTIITYVSNDQSVFLLRGEDSIEITQSQFRQNLEMVSKNTYLNTIDSLFKPSKFLVSPFNNTNEFIMSKYFLTGQQTDFSKRILKYQFPIQLIHGNPGTGKTLLLYDIVRKENSSKSVMVIHCGQLNRGHHRLIEEFDWDIRNAHHSWIFDENPYEDVEVVFIDEAQRLKRKQLEHIIKMSEKHGFKIVISMDPRQYLSNEERRYQNYNYISSLIPKEGIYKLSEKIRSNKEIAMITKVIFSGENYWDRKYNSVSLEFLNDADDFDNYIDTLRELGWVYLPYTQSKYTRGIKYEKFCLINDSQNSHKIIGQEFNKVAIILDESFSLDDEKGYIKYSGPSYYDPRQMLFQNITRAREELKLIIYNNDELFEKLLRIVTKNRN